MPTTMKQTEEKMNAALQFLEAELKNLRTGRAHPALVEGVKVEVYGTMMRILDVASITVPEPRQLVISPFDPHNSSAIGKAIEKANLGINPIVEANLVRLNIPPMDGTMRAKMIKMCHEFGENAKVNIRQVRQASNEIVRKQKSSGDISEDEMHRKEKEIQDLTDKFCKKCDEMAKKKETEISTI